MIARYHRVSQSLARFAIRSRRVCRHNPPGLNPCRVVLAVIPDETAVGARPGMTIFMTIHDPIWGRSFTVTKRLTSRHSPTTRSNRAELSTNRLRSPRMRKPLISRPITAWGTSERNCHLHQLCGRTVISSAVVALPAVHRRRVYRRRRLWPAMPSRSGPFPISRRPHCG